MKQSKILLAALILLVGFTTFSCTNASRNDLEDAGDKISDAVKKDKEVLSDELRQTKVAINEKIADLRIRLDNATDETKDDINRQLNELDQWSKEVDQKMDRLGEQVDDGWDAFKADVRETIRKIDDNLKTSNDNG
ncbi:MAG TPA: hypothetical protein PKE06_21185 [Flavilitoribacter sp.]|nr:hypothetical protein [Flavilitoribacter sp.]HMQ87469.1 hypothetical protein [Flavilitoribacter sp.]